MLVDLDVLDCDAPAILKELAAAGTPCYGIQWPEAYEERRIRNTVVLVHISSRSKQRNTPIPNQFSMTRYTARRLMHFVLKQFVCSSIRHGKKNILTDVSKALRQSLQNIQNKFYPSKALAMQGLLLLTILQNVV